MTKCKNATINYKIKKCIYIIVVILLSSCSFSSFENSDQNHYERGKTAYENNEYEKAISIFETIITDFSWSKKVDASHYYCGRALVKCFEEGIRSNSSNTALNALDHFSQINTRSTFYVKAQYQIGYCYYILAEFDQCRDKLINLYNTFPSNSKSDNGCLLVGHQFLDQNQLDSACIWYNKVIEEYPNSGSFDDALFRLGTIYLQHAENKALDTIINPAYFPKAIKRFKQVSVNSKYYIESQYNIGYSFYRLENYDSTLQYHEKVLENAPNSSKADNACLYIGHVWRKRENSDKALLWYEKIIADYPQTGAYDNALYWAGDNYYDRDWEINNNKEKAIALLKEYCTIADSTNSKYSKAQKKLKKLESR